MFNKQLIPGRVEDIIDNEIFVETILPDMLITATDIAEQLKGDEIKEGSDKLFENITYFLFKLKLYYSRYNPK